MTRKPDPPPAVLPGCWSCAAWTQGAVVVNGSTLGTCQVHERWTTADEMCLAHQRPARPTTKEEKAP